MTDKELKKLSRAELLEMLLLQTKEVERLHQELADVKAQLAQRNIRMDNAGSIAEAALQLSGVFEKAQDAANLYLDNIRSAESRTQEVCRKMETETRRKCEKMLQNAKRESNAFWEEVRDKIHDPFMEHEQWMQIVNMIDSKVK